MASQLEIMKQDYRLQRLGQHQAAAELYFMSSLEQWTANQYLDHIP